MKRILLSIFAICAINASAQSKIETFSVYDVNHDTAITVEDVTKVVNHVVKANVDSPQTVDAAALNELLKSIDNRLARIEEELGIVIEEQDPEDKPQEGQDSDEQDKDEHEWVDLGLPSGTLWATCNIGANSPEDFGDYFAWGETKTKYYYDWETYFDSENGSINKFRKYNKESNLSTLELDDDAAYVNWGKNWRIPSSAQYSELRNKCIWTWIKKNNVNGYEVKSKFNGESIFLPAAGMKSGSTTMFGSGDYWLNGIYYSTNSNTAQCVSFYSSDISNNTSTARCQGFTIRPVRAIKE